MVIILKFNCEDPNDKVALERCLAAPDLCAVLSDMDDLLRSESKYGGSEVAGKLRDTFHEFMVERGIDLTRLWA